MVQNILNHDYKLKSFFFSFFVKLRLHKHQTSASFPHLCLINKSTEMITQVTKKHYSDLSDLLGLAHEEAVLAAESVSSLVSSLSLTNSKVTFTP
jgi:hypothetical protein